MQQPLFIKWQEKNDTGIILIDEQHRGIVSIINSLYFLTAKGMCNDTLCSFISDTMKNYSRIHFITEERFLQEAGYPDFEEHKELHRKLTQETERMEQAALKKNDILPFLDFLKKWWLEHINEKDMLYAPHLREYFAVHRQSD